MENKSESGTFLKNKKPNSPPQSNRCNSKWWNQGYRHQKFITEIIESFNFRALIIFLVVVDTSLVVTEIMLDSLKIEYECEAHYHRAAKEHNKMMKERVEHIMEYIHYGSIAILSFFVIELIVKIWAFGKEFWNIHRRKMEYFDAFIVLTSLAIDIYFLQGEEKILGKRLLLILSFRLWRFVRIISSVAEGLSHGQLKHKELLNKQYLLAIKRLVELSAYKTSCYESNNKEQLDTVLERCRKIDDQCKKSLEALNENHELTSTQIVEHFIKELNGLEDEQEKNDEQKKNNDSKTFDNSTEV